MVVRANQEAASEPIKAVLKGKPHVFESWSDFIIYYFDSRHHVIVIMIIPAPYAVAARYTNILISLK